MRDQDRPPADGRMQRACLRALAEPATIGETAARLAWSHTRTRSWVHHLRHRGLVRRVSWTTVASGHVAGRYQRVEHA